MNLLGLISRRKYVGRLTRHSPAHRLWGLDPMQQLIAAIRQNWRAILLLSFLMLIGMVGAYIDLRIGHD